MCFGGAAILERDRHHRKVMLGAYKVLEKVDEGEPIPTQVVRAVMFELEGILGMPSQLELPLGDACGKRRVQRPALRGNGLR